MTTAQFRNKLETLDRDDLETYSDITEAFGAPLMAYCDRPDVADATVSGDVDLDDECSRALAAITRGESLETVHGYLSDAHPGAAGARAILTDLHRQWHIPQPA